MTTSYSNPCGSGNRTDLSVALWTERPIGGTATFNGNPLVLIGASDLVYNGADGECRINLDLMEPRIVDAIEVVYQYNQGTGLCAIEGSDDGVTWVTLRAAEDLFSVGGRAEFAFVNATPYRYYSIHRVSGGGGGWNYIFAVNLKIDNAADPAWRTPYSTGNRTSLVTIGGTAWASSSFASSIINGGNAWYDDPYTYFAAGSGAGRTVTFTFNAPVCLTGFRWARINYDLVAKAQAKDALGNWIDISEPFALSPTYSKTNTPAGSATHVLCERTWANAVEYTEYRLLIISGTSVSGVYPGEISFRIGAILPPDPPAMRRRQVILIN